MMKTLGRVEARCMNNVVLQIRNGPRQTELDFFSRSEGTRRGNDAKTAFRRVGQIELGEGITISNDVVFVEWRGWFVTTNRIDTGAFVHDETRVAGDRIQGAATENATSDDTERQKFERAHRGP